MPYKTLKKLYKFNFLTDTHNMNKNALMLPFCAFLDIQKHLKKAVRMFQVID